MDEGNVVGHNSAGYTGQGTTWTNEEFGMNHTTDAGLTARPFDLQSSMISLYHSCSKIWIVNEQMLEYITIDFF